MVKYVLGIGVVVWLNVWLTDAFLLHSRLGLRGDSFDVLHSQSANPEQPVFCNADTYSIIQQCGKNLRSLIFGAFPWNDSNDRKWRQKGFTLKDPLDPINVICKVFDDFRTCLDEHSILSACVLSGDGIAFEMQVVFDLLCHKSPRTTELLRSLTCVRDTRILDLLVWHMADIYGPDSIDDQAQGSVNALFRISNSDSLLSGYLVNPLILHVYVTDGLVCFPESVIFQNVSSLISGRCGGHAASLVTSYYMGFREHLNTLLEQTGFRGNVCDKELAPRTAGAATDSTSATDSSKFSSQEASCTSFDAFLGYHSAETAMDTVYGRALGAYIRDIPAREFCQPDSGLDLAYSACFLLSYHTQGKAVFNVVQYAHSMAFPFLDLPVRSRMEIFHRCCTLLQQICGQMTRYDAYSSSLASGSWEIRSMMDNLTCEWQDMLIRRYLAASHDGNMWPTGYNFPKRPIFLSSGVYSFGSITGSFVKLLSMLDPGVKEISAKCNKVAGKRIEYFYEQLKYGFYDKVKFLQMNTEDIHFVP